MKLNLVLLLGVPLIFALSACEEQADYRRNTYATRKMKTAYEDVQLPVSLWKHLEAVFTGAGTTANSGGEGEGEASASHGDEMSASRGGDTSASRRISTQLMGLKVYLIEKNPGILGGKNHELLFGDGGGEIDLKDFIEDRNGTFFLAIEPVLDLGDSIVRVFYHSNAVKRHLPDGETVGAGCRTYHEISSFFAKEMKGEGIMVNTTAGRHVSVLAGAYFFAVSQADKLHLTQLTIKDSRYKRLHCRRH